MMSDMEQGGCMIEYTECDQCIRKCRVDQLRCENGRKHYYEVTGKEYQMSGETAEAAKDSGAAYRRKIRERRARKKQSSDNKGTENGQ